VILHDLPPTELQLELLKRLAKRRMRYEYAPNTIQPTRAVIIGLQRRGLATISFPWVTITERGRLVLAGEDLNGRL